MTSEKKSKSTGKKFYCPCCGNKKSKRNPFADRSDYFEESCHCCGYQYAHDENVGACGQAISLPDYRRFWIKDGCRWFHGNDPRPIDWSITVQLAEAGISSEK